MKRVLVTGAAGFVAAAAIPRLRQDGWEVVGAVRATADAAKLPEGCRPAVVGEIGPETDWSSALDGVEAVVHLAARVHQDGEGRDHEAAHQRVNLMGTRALAQAAAKAGARRLLFLSSVKAMGKRSPAGGHWTEKSPCAPEDAYGRSKLEAEHALLAIEAEAGLSTCILRAPLIYGPGVRANMARLIALIAAGWPLPFGSVANRRSFLFVGNLADAIARCLARPDVAGVFLIGDGQDVSSAELVRRIAAALSRPARLVSVPPALLRVAASVAGRGAEIDRLLGDLAIDDSLLRAELGWRPPFTMEEGLAATVKAMRP